MKCVWETAVLMMTFIPAASGQSLADAARKESERRKALDDAGIAVKSYENHSLPWKAAGNVTTGTAETGDARRGSLQLPSKGKNSVAPYRAALKKLDHAIVQCEEQLAFSRRKYELERNILRRSVKLNRSQTANTASERLLLKVQELEARLKGLRQERQETYHAGRKAGFQPGELDGHALAP